MKPPPLAPTKPYDIWVWTNEEIDWTPAENAIAEHTASLLARDARYGIVAVPEHRREPDRLHQPDMGDPYRAAHDATGPVRRTARQRTSRSRLLPHRPALPQSHTDPRASAWRQRQRLARATAHRPPRAAQRGHRSRPGRPYRNEAPDGLERPEEPIRANHGRNG